MEIDITEVDTSKATERESVEATLETWMVVRTCLGLASEREDGPDAVKQIIGDMGVRLGQLLVDRGVVTQAWVDGSRKWH
jgi:hypothetical protein